MDLRSEVIVVESSRREGLMQRRRRSEGRERERLTPVRPGLGWLARAALSACLAMARCISSGSSTSLTSTAVTFTPHGSVASSMMCCSFWLICSRSASSSSSSACPSTLRKVVWAIWEVATQ